MLHLKPRKASLGKFSSKVMARVGKIIGICLAEIWPNSANFNEFWTNFSNVERIG